MAVIGIAVGNYSSASIKQKYAYKLYYLAGYKPNV